MTIKQGLGFGGALAIIALVGCGGSGGSGATGGSGGASSVGTGGSSGGGNSSGGAFTTSVPSGTKVTSLTSAQGMQLCKDYDTFAAAHLSTICKQQAIFDALDALGGSDAQIQAACTASYNDCLSPDGGENQCDPTDISSNSVACTATVGDITTCFNSEYTLDSELPSCSTLTAATLLATEADGGVLNMEPAGCAALENCGASSDAASSSSLGAVIAHRPHR